MTTLRLPFPDDWELSSEVLDAAMQAIDSRFTVSRAYHVPYVAGYSEPNGMYDQQRVIYIDHRLPDHYKERDSGKVVRIDQYLVLHEAIEVTLEALTLPYQLRHQLALRLELAAVQADGVDLEQYNDFFAYWIGALEKEGYDDLPPDLDMTPYEDEDEFYHGHGNRPKFAATDVRE